MQYLLFPFFIAYLIVTIRFQKKILEDKILNSKQKIINSVLIWMIPFLWGWVLNSVFKPVDGAVGERKKDLFGEAGGGGTHYDSGDAFH